MKQAETRFLQQLHIEIKDSFYSVGVPDFSNAIPADCVVVIGPDGLPLAEERDVLLYRNPGKCGGCGR